MSSLYLPEIYRLLAEGKREQAVTGGLGGKKRSKAQAGLRAEMVPGRPKH